MTNSDREEIVFAFEEAQDKLAEAIEALRQAERMLEFNGQDRLAERCKSMVRSHIEMAASNDHMWMGGNMTTLADIVEEVKDAFGQVVGEKCPDCGQHGLDEDGFCIYCEEYASLHK